jgi:GH15 family glucan-1,4-alpha-glucosidase
MSATSPSATSTHALYLSNWQDLVGIWKAARLTQLDQAPTAPCLRELHYLRGSLARRTVNQIVDYSGFFRDETNHVSYTHATDFDSEAWFESGTDDAGLLTTNYLNYQDQATSVRISRSFAAPPNQPFFIVRYVLTNPGAGEIELNVLDQVHLNNLDASKSVHAWHEPERDALIADMTAPGQLFVVLGALQAPDGYQAGRDSDASTQSATVSGWYSFDADGTLRNNNEVTAPDVTLAFNQRARIGAGKSATLYFYIGVCETEADARAAIDAARASTGDAWLAKSAAAWNAWLANGNQGRRTHFDDDALNQMVDRALILMKNVQNPVLGTLAATTNPFAYSYKNWVRDASVAAMALDASGHFAEGEQYWRWMSGSQSSDGTWKTTYNAWDGSYVPFVEPEYDSVGAFLFGVYQHYMLTADAGFLRDLWPSVKRAADWIIGNIQSNGFGQADYSIWEEGDNLEHNGYTQGWFVAGLYATQAMCERLGETALTEWYAGGAASIMTAVQRSCEWSPPGLWNPQGYFNRAVNLNDTPRTLVDSSSDMPIALGVIDHESGRASSHVATVTGQLTRQGYGIARYAGDMFYYTGAWSPGGNEALGPEPSWPQMGLWIAVFDILRGQSPAALARMQWCAGVWGKGYMAPGEAVSNVSMQPLVSSMCESLTAAAFVLTALVYSGQSAFSCVPPLYNAGAFKSVNIGAGAAEDGAQWSNLPYFVAERPATSVQARAPEHSIKRVYIANDYDNLYLRIDNVAGLLLRYQMQPAFGLHIYAQDLAGAGAQTSNFGLFNQPLSRPMSFMVERRSDAETYQHFRVSGATWIADDALRDVEPPQWNPDTGRIEAVVPIRALSSANAVFGGWANLLVVVIAHDPVINVWADVTRMLLHYRLSTQDQAWIYGNIEM